MIPVLLLYIIDEAPRACVGALLANMTGPGTPPSFETSVAK